MAESASDFGEKKTDGVKRVGAVTLCSTRLIELFDVGCFADQPIVKALAGLAGPRVLVDGGFLAAGRKDATEEDRALCMGLARK